MCFQYSQSHPMTKKSEKNVTRFLLLFTVFFFSFSFGAAANVVFVAVRDDLVLKHSNNKTKITPKTDKQNVQNEICLPKRCRWRRRTQKEDEKSKEGIKKRWKGKGKGLVTVTDKHIFQLCFNMFFFAFSILKYEIDANDRQQSKGVMTTNKTQTHTHSHTMRMLDFL